VDFIGPAFILAAFLSLSLIAHIVGDMRHYNRNNSAQNSLNNSQETVSTAPEVEMERVNINGLQAPPANPIQNQQDLNLRKMYLSAPMSFGGF
jgi:hypothetical protein